MVYIPTLGLHRKYVGVINRRVKLKLYGKVGELHEKIKHFYHGLYIYVHMLHISFNISIINKTKTFTSGSMYKFLKVIWPSGNFPQIITLYLHGYFFKGGSSRCFKKQTLIPRGLRTGGTGPP